MASLYHVPPSEEHKFYKDYWTSFEDQLNALKESSTVYVGNLSFNICEERIYDLFNRCGVVQNVIMGINRYDGSPCGFCFVVYDCHESAQNSVYFLNGFLLDGQPVRIEMDWGFSEGRQYGRAPNGGQRRHYLNEIKSENNNRYNRNDRRRGGNYNRNPHNRRWNDYSEDRRRERDYYDDDREDKRRRY